MTRPGLTPRSVRSLLLILGCSWIIIVRARFLNWEVKRVGGWEWEEGRGQHWVSSSVAFHPIFLRWGLSPTLELPGLATLVD